MACSGSSPTFTAASASIADVQACIDASEASWNAANTITIPPDDTTYTSAGPIIVRGVKIVGAGAGSTIIRRATDQIMFVVGLSSASETFEIRGIEFAHTSGTATGYPAIFYLGGTCNSTTCSHVVLAENTFSGWDAGTGQLIHTNNMFGVIGNNTFTGASYILLNNGLSAYKGVGEFGDKSWAMPDTYGSDEAIYFENNAVTGTAYIAVTDTDNTPGGGSRFVGRFNTLTNAGFQTHGSESTGRTRGGRQYEVYKNSFTLNSGQTFGFDIVGWRSGTGLVLENTVDDQSSPGGFSGGLSLTNYRDGISFYPWGNANGSDANGPYDNNDSTVFDSGTVTAQSLSGSTLTITDNTKTWTTNQWTVFSMVNIDRTENNGGVDYDLGAPITSNTPTVLTSTLYDYKDGGIYATAWQVGDHYQIRKSTASLDQAGRGGNGAQLLANNPPTPTGWVSQPLDPIYEAANTGSTPTYGWVKSQGTIRFTADVDFYTQVSQTAQTSTSSPFNGTTGTGYGTLANRPTTCTVGVGYWATDQGSWNTSGSGGQGILYTCTTTDNWTLSYTPYAYPHPLISGEPPPPPDEPTFNYKGTFTVQSGQMASSETGFSFLIYWTDNALKQVAGGGQVLNANGYDIRPYSDSSLTAALSYQLIRYDGSAGTIHMRVKNTGGVGNSIYMGVGSSDLSTDGSRTAAWDSNTKAAYNFGNGSSLSLVDSAHANNLTNNGSATAAAGKVDGAVTLNGSSQFLNTTTGYLAGDTTHYTVSAWAYPASTSAGAHNIFTLGGAGYSIQLRRDGSDWNLYQNDGSNLNATQASGVTVNTWKHIVGVWDGSKIRLYVNGSQAQETTASSRVANGTVQSWGYELIDNVQYWDGRLDECRIDDTARSAAWITSVYNNENNQAAFWGTVSFVEIGAVVPPPIPVEPKRGQRRGHLRRVRLA